MEKRDVAVAPLFIVDRGQALAGKDIWLPYCCLVLFLLAVSSPTIAGQLITLSITENNGEFESDIVALFDAPAEHVYAVITDYRHIYRINPSIVETELLPAEIEGVTRVRNVIQHCFLVFCTEVELVEDVAEVDHGLLVALTVPEASSFGPGIAMWHIHPFGKGRTRVQYRASIKPDFFIPPVIGSLVIKSNIQRELTTSFKRIECLAKIMSTNDTADTPVVTATRPHDAKDCAG